MTLEAYTLEWPRVVQLAYLGRLENAKIDIPAAAMHLRRNLRRLLEADHFPDSQTIGNFLIRRNFGTDRNALPPMRAFRQIVPMAGA
jgi:hypothetical protein